ncbi:hypothetical protein BcabD6B2_59090 (apicoplast) [Babesia caballi]|uniref:RNA-binding S4 domain-containing protein n=1 Tax=Babesia caballi TaxID=5871 RepID=A0AAV4M1W9_BABCB|nr:hypothetical protein BcabD6B2_59090 [Babesia caballi]
MQKKHNKIKILKKFNLCTLHGLTNKFNLYYKNYKKFTGYKLTKNIQLLKILYNLKNKQLTLQEFNISYFTNITKSLKFRVDSILLESNLFKTLNSARQYISHKHILLNNKIIINCGYKVKNSDILHSLNFTDNIYLSNIIYNHINKNLKTHSVYNNIYKIFKRRKKYSKNIIMYNDFTVFSNIICYKNLKIQINIKNKIFRPVNSGIINFV